MIFTTLILTVGLSCTTTSGLTVCTEVDGAELRALEQNQLLVQFQRQCMSAVPPNKRSQYPGGFIKLLRDCETEARDKVRNLTHSVDQNGVQRR